MRAIALSGSIAALAAVGVLIAPSAAHAADDTIYTWAYSQSDATLGGFATLSTYPKLELLGSSTIDVTNDSDGVEVCGGTGYAIQDEGYDSPRYVPFTLSDGLPQQGSTTLVYDVNETVEMDALDDCTLLTIANITEGNATAWSVVSFDASGEVTSLAELGSSPDLDRLTGIATSPDGTTYIFTELESLTPAYAVVELTTGLVGPWVEMAGVGAVFNNSQARGIDFDESGRLWFMIDPFLDGQFHLASIAPGADLAIASPADYGPTIPGSNNLNVRSNAPLAVTGVPSLEAPAPATEAGAPTQLAATGSEAPLGITGVIALIVAGGVLLVLRRRADEPGHGTSVEGNSR